MIPLCDARCVIGGVECHTGNAGQGEALPYVVVKALLPFGWSGRWFVREAVA